MTFQCIVRLGIRVLWMLFAPNTPCKKFQVTKFVQSHRNRDYKFAYAVFILLILVTYISHEVILILFISSSFSLIHTIHHKRNNRVNEICRNWQKFLNCTVLDGILKREHVAPKQSRTYWSWTKKNDVNCLFHFTF